MIALRFIVAIGACAMVSATAFARDGMIDTGFGNAGRYDVVPSTDLANHIARTYAFNAIATLPDGSLIAAGFMDRSLPLPLTEPDFRVIVSKLHADGSPDLAFGNDEAHPGLLVLDDLEPAAFMENANSIAVLEDGGVIVGGLLNDGNQGGFTLRFDPEGKLVDDYAQHGISRLPFGVYDLAVDSRKRVVVVGILVDVQNLRGIVTRISSASGEVDPTFGDAGFVQMLEYDEDGQVINHDGGLKAVAIGPDDAVYVAGTQGNSSEDNVFWFEYSLAKLVGDGEFDQEFANGGWLRFLPAWAADSRTNTLADIIVQGDQLIVAGGYLGEQDEGFPMVGRFSLKGQPDQTFGQFDSPGFARPELFKNYSSQTPVQLAQEDDGRIVLGLNLDDPARNGKLAVIRLTPEGTPDPLFGKNGESALPSLPSSILGNTHALTLQPNRVVMAGIDGFRDEQDRLYIGASVVGISSADVFHDDFGGE